MSKGEGKKLAIGAAVAAVTGYVAGILTAPKSGKETRKDIKETADKSVAELELRLKKTHAELNKAITTATGEAENLKGKAKTELEAAVDGATVAREKANELLSAARKGEAKDRDLQKALDEVAQAFEHLKKYLKK